MSEFNTFYEMISRTLSLIDDSYYRTTYENLHDIRMALGHRGRFEENKFIRYGERIFCYEFYAILRGLIWKEKQVNSKFLEGIQLQGEVRKFQVLDLIQHFGLNPLDGEYVPDFIVHSPGSADRQFCVIEVKADPDVSHDDIFHDLDKLDQFITRFNYEHGMFLAVNISPQVIEEKLQILRPRIQHLHGRERILIICKSNRASDLINITL